MKLLFIYLSFFLFISLKTLLAQKHTISGYIIDNTNGEKLIGANVFDSKSKKGMATNTYGFYSLTLANDSVNLVISYLGFVSQNKRFSLTNDTLINVHLNENLELKEVEIVADRIEKIEDKVAMSTIEISISQIENIPALMGEVDVLKAVQLLPGVQSGGEGGSGMYVRGGGPDQNLILLDGATVYNASHLFGFFSVFNSNSIKNVELVKGGFPARYGGRLSSVLDISMKEGNNKKLSGEGSVGIISSNLTLEGPIKNENTSFIISARRTYADILARPFIAYFMSQNNQKGYAGYFFYDINAKINHKISNKDHMYLSMYAGRDKF
jgi:outer membrane cobalamin receptor